MTIDPTKPDIHDGPRGPESVIFLRSPRANPCPPPWQSAPQVILGSDDWEERIQSQPDRLLVAWGGDGTLQAAARLGRPCALVAAGTGNDVAADLGLPRGVAVGLASLQRPACWHALPMSMVLVAHGQDRQSHPMVNALSAGLGGNAAAKLKPFRWCGPLAYPLAAFRGLFSSQPFDCNGVRSRHVVVGRGGRHGGGIRIGPKGSRWSEGLRTGGWTNWGDILLGVLRVCRGRTVFATSSFLGGKLHFDPTTPIEIDGEPMWADRVEIEALSQPLLIRVPHRRCTLQG